MEEKQSQAAALALLSANTGPDVAKILKQVDLDYWFSNPQNWRPYGGRPKNWDIVGNQQTNPIGALVELITNGIDSILLRKARESGIRDFRGPDVPQTMFEAVKLFFPLAVEGRITNLEPKQQTELAEQCMLVGIRRADRINSTYPTFTFVDFGDGQLPERFQETFLSLSERNKEGIPFVQGKFNMGSTGSLRFCTKSDILQGHYKLILSRSPESAYWGWTLIRVRRPGKGEALPVAEYFMPNGVCPRFRMDSIQSFGDDVVGVVSQGTIVKLYQFDVGGTKAHTVDLGLYQALTVSLLECALPIRLYDFDAKPVPNKGELRQKGIAARTFGGMNVVLGVEVSDEGEGAGAEAESDRVERRFLVREDSDEELGRLRIVAIGIREMQSFLSSQQARIFYTVNGQTHAFERASFLNNPRVALGDLRSHLIVNVVCDDMDKTALAAIFMPDRERKANNQLARRLENLVIDALKGDPELRKYAAEIRLRRAKEYSEDQETSTDLLDALVKMDPGIKELFGIGAMVEDIKAIAGGDEPFVGSQFPTFLSPLNLRSGASGFVKEVPLKGNRRIECGTDAANDYLTRVDSPGKTWCSLDHRDVPHSIRLRNGTASITLHAPSTAEVGDSQVVEFGFVDNGRNVEPLKFSVEIKFVEEEKALPGKSGKASGTAKETAKAKAYPRFEWVTEQLFQEHNFDENSGAYVQIGEQTCVYVNRDNKYLKNIRLREKDDAAREISEAIFKYSLGLCALSIHQKASEEGGVDDAEFGERTVRLATKALASHVVSVVRELGGTQPNIR